MTTYVIADMHGRYDLFVEALRAIGGHANGRPGKLVVLGDFVDRGPQSKQIIDRLMAEPPAGWSWIVVQGNHEDIMLQALADPRLLHWWMGNGGGYTLLSFGHPASAHVDPSVVPSRYRSWLAQLPTLHEDEHRIYVHAGLDADLPLADQDKHTIQWGLYTDPYPDSTRLVDRPHMSGKHIVHGHHQSATNPLRLPHRTNLDSFAWYTGNLAIAVFDDDTPGGPVDVLWARAAADARAMS